jgi:hypothetical protein
VSPILVRPVREQLEHDRVIRLLQVKLKRKNDVTANIGEDQSTPVKIGQLQIYPDLILTSSDRGHKLMCTVEVETSESVNHLEARAQWAHLGKARAPFHLYVPASSVDIARRLAAENQVNVSEIWTYHTIGDQTHFKLAQRAPGVPQRVAGSAAEARSAPAPRPEPRPGTSAKPRPAAGRSREQNKRPVVASRPAKKRAAPARRPNGGAARAAGSSGRNRSTTKSTPTPQKRK